MRIPAYIPTNSFINRELDRRWRDWLSHSLIGALLLALGLAGFIAPRQATMRMRYQIAQTKREISRIDDDIRHLRLEKETLTSPALLAASLPELGLAPIARPNVAYLSPDGTLHFPAPPPTPTPAVPTPGKRGVR